MSKFLNKAMSRSEMNSFQEQELQMDDRYSRIFGEAVDRIVGFLQIDMPWNVAKTIKGGSLGKGTAIGGSSDLDAVVFLNDFRDMEDFGGKIRKMIEQMNTKMEKMDYFKQRKLIVERPTHYASKFKLTIDSEEISVDLLPAYDNIGRKGKHALYEEMRRTSNRSKEAYSSSLVELQVNFVKKVPASVKNLIRVVKHWRKTYIPESTAATAGRRLPTSYPLELITIGLWERQGRPEHFDLRRGFKAVLQQLINYDSINFYWTENYSTPYVHKQHGEPYILDPANPHKNVADSSNAWSEVARYAHSAMKEPLLYQLQGSSWN